MTIGARVLKTGLAVAFALWVGMLIGLKSPLIAAIAAIFTIQPSIYRSWKQILEQVQSNLLGAAIAIGAVWLVGTTPISVGLVSICVILLCLKIGTEETIGLTLVTVVVVMEAGGSQGWLVAADRLGSIMTGIVSAFLVNVAIAPPRHAKRFVKMVQDAQTLMSRLLRTTVSNELKENVFRDELEKLSAQIRKLEEFYELFTEERVWGRNTRMGRARLLVVYKGMIEALALGRSLIMAVEDHYFAVRTTKEWNRLVDRQIETLCGYHEQLMWKWEGHMKPGASAAAPPPEATALLTEMIADRSVQEETIARARLLVVTTSVFSYEDRLRRLDKLMENYLSRSEANGPGEHAAEKA
ncbi:FUSC family protein [Cohnella candidum]|uniref:Aromatic acid exporter family protein n=1 Tax=Cohnella candidum TaxID=2674991 RepID=A0A3G3K5L8_9BACL|nr:aromatic acid exporter family protein [Cohnella candidum]AYQ75079.1 aromatic acid exporter family protein [Cohnella candidum]